MLAIFQQLCYSIMSIEKNSFRLRGDRLTLADIFGDSIELRRQ